MFKMFKIFKIKKIKWKKISSKFIQDIKILMFKLMKKPEIKMKYFPFVWNFINILWIKLFILVIKYPKLFKSFLLKNSWKISKLMSLINYKKLPILKKFYMKIKILQYKEKKLKIL